MKLMKKLIVVFVAVLMVMSLTSKVYADGKNDSITITNAKVGETYAIYKMFDLSVNDESNPTAYTYTVNSAWSAFFAPAGEGTEAGPGAQYVTISNGNVTAISDAAALAKAAAEWTGKPVATQSITVTEGNNTAVFSGLADGYWLVTSTLGNIAMAETTPDKAAVTIEEKNPLDTIDKKVKEDSTNVFGTSNDAQIGDTIEFKSTVKIVKGTRNVVVHDKMSPGLTYTVGSVAIPELQKGTNYTVDESPADEDTFDITFVQSWIDDLDFGTTGYKEYEITYTAVLNENAVEKDDNGVAIVDQNNKTKVSFGDGQTSQEKITDTKTHKFSVYKHAKDATDNLAGAVFQLKKGNTVVSLIRIDDKNYRVAKTGETGAVQSFTTVASGDIVVWGVDSDDDYTLTETEAPKGYNPLPNPVQVTVNAGNSTRADIENQTGAELPSTGGIGTTIFHIAGAALVLGAGILLISKKRMNNN